MQLIQREKTKQILTIYGRRSKTIESPSEGSAYKTINVNNISSAREFASTHPGCPPDSLATPSSRPGRPRVSHRPWQHYNARASFIGDWLDAKIAIKTRCVRKTLFSRNIRDERSMLTDSLLELKLTANEMFR